MTARPVLSPDGTRYESASAAAEALGMCRKLVAKKAAKGTAGWSYADVDPSLVSKIEDILIAMEDMGATIGEVAKIVYGGYVSSSQRSVISATLRALVHAGRARKTSEMRAVTSSVRPGAVYVSEVRSEKRIARPSVETGAGNIRHGEGRRRRKPQPSERMLAVLPESETPQELMLYAAQLRRDWPVAPLRGGRWLVDDVEVTAADLVALARGEVRLRELREGWRG